MRGGNRIGKRRSTCLITCTSYVKQQLVNRNSIINVIDLYQNHCNAMIDKVTEVSAIKVTD